MKIVFHTTSAHDSWCEHVSGAVSPPAGALAALVAVMADDHAVPPTPNPMNPRGPPVRRKQATYGSEYVFGAQRSLRLGGDDEAAWPVIVRLALNDARAREGVRGERYRGAHVNYYADGKAALAQHNDKDGPWDPTMPIYSYTFLTDPSKPRVFRITRNGATERDILLSHGDLLVMGGDMQKTHKHGVPPRTTASPRINITVRALPVAAEAAGI